MPLRLVMMGTGAFALPAFVALCESGHKIAALFTQPDRTGRGHHRHVNPMKQAARQRDIPVFQPAGVNDPAALNDLKSLNSDLCVVAAYGQILSAELLAIPRLGAINLHASLLPKYRGAAPVQYAIWNGETETGVTIFQLEPKLDAGPILGATKTEILPNETAGELEQRLAELAVGLTLQVVAEIEAGTTKPVDQNPAQVTRAPRIRKEQGAVDWSRSADEIGCHVRAMQPWPKAFTFLRQPGREPLRVILREVKPLAASDVPEIALPERAQHGTLICRGDEQLLVQAGNGLLEILKIQPAGKREMTAAEFLHGHPLQTGDRFTARRSDD